MARVLCITILLLAAITAPAERSAEDAYELGRFYLQARAEPEAAMPFLQAVLDDDSATEALHAKALYALAYAQLELRDFAASAAALQRLEELYVDRPNEMKAVLAEWGTPAAHAGDRQMENTHEKLLDLITFRRLRFEQVPIQAVFNELEERASELAPDGANVNIITRLTPDTDYHVTCDFANISLREALRYICRHAELTFRVEEHAVIIARFAGCGFETRFYPLSEELLEFTAACEDRKPADVEASEWSMMVKRMFLSLGLSWPSGTQVTVDLRTRTLIVTNSLEIHRAVLSILMELKPTIYQAKVTASFVEVTDPAFLAEMPATRITYDALRQIPADKDRTLHTVSMVTVSGETALLDSGDAWAFRATPVINMDDGLVSVDVEVALPEAPQRAVYMGSLVIRNGAGVVMPIEFDDRLRLMVIRVQVLDIDGRPVGERR